MISFQEFMILCEAAYDKEVMSGSQVRTMGQGGRISPERKKPKPQRRRTRRTGGGQSEPSEYKPRSDIGKQRAASERQEQPEQERGSADVRARAAAAAKEERRKAALARRDAKSGEGESAPKPRSKDLERQASQLLSRRRKPKAKAPVSDERFSSSRNPEDHMIKGKYTRAEKKELVRAGKRKLRDLVLQATGKRKESELKNKYTGPDVQPEDEKKK